jgi:tetratricopeptide (TPR) repeat protein
MPAANPFPGLRPFETTEGYLFFGREGRSEELLKRLLDVRLLAVVGSSGSGKSSLVRAGLIPHLQKLSQSRWRVAIFRPAGDPIASLRDALNRPDVIGKVAESEEDAARDKALLEARLRRSALGLIEVVRLARLDEGQNLLVVIDQFEELFRFADAPDRRGDGSAFVNLILEAMRQTDVPIYVMLTMRSDFIGDCAQFRDLPETVAAGLYLIPRMTRDERRAAIEKPIEIAGGRIAHRLVNRVLNDAGDDPDQLPIMQHALMRTWEQWQKSGPPDRPIDIEDYDEIGGMAHALSKHANDAFNDLDAEGKKIAQRMFQCLTEQEDNRQIRRATDAATLAKVVGVTQPQLFDVIENFRQAGRSFLMPSPPAPLNGDTRVDISHESLIRRWDQLAEWVGQESESAATYRRLEETAVLHDQKKAGLWGDPDVANTLAWKERVNPTEAWAERYGGHFETATGFLEQSRRARDAALRRKRQILAAVVGVTVLVIAGLSVITTVALVEKRNAQLATLSARQAEQNARDTTVDFAQVATLAREQLSEALDSYLDNVGSALEWAPPSWAAYLHRQKANVLREQGDFTGARTEYDAAMKANPDYLPVLVSSSDLSITIGDGQRAARDAGSYLSIIKTDVVAYGNLIIAQAIQGNYAQSIGDIDTALNNAHLPIGDTETVVAPDVQGLTHGFHLSVPDSDFLLGLRYLKAILYAMSGDDRFKAALDAADQSDSDRYYSRNAYLAALNWQWLIVRGQARNPTQATGPSTDGGDLSSAELADYGAYAIEGALWDRVARTRPAYRAQATAAYNKFLAAYRQNPQARYASLAAWVDEQLRTPVQAMGPEDPVVDRARGLAQLAQELKASSGSHPLQFAPAFAELSQAIDLLTPKPGTTLGRRQRDLLIDLLLRRANWRLEGSAAEQDKGGAVDDARAAIALDPRLPEAYWLLATAAFDDDSRQANDEHALGIDPFYASALQDLANLVQTNDPKCALALLQRRQRMVTTWADDYAQLAQLQTSSVTGASSYHCPVEATSIQIPDYPAALGSIESAIAIAPWQIDLYTSRRDIEQKLGRDKALTDLHFVQGMRDAAEYDVRTGVDGLGLQKYVRAFILASSLDTNNDDAKFALDAIIRELSAFISKNYRREDAVQFWRALSQDPLLTPTQKQLAAQEADRLARQP